MSIQPTMSSSSVATKRGKSNLISLSIHFRDISIGGASTKLRYFRSLATSDTHSQNP
jgi:hypothetical protein